MTAAIPVARDVKTRLISSVLFPLHERLKRHDTVEVRRNLEASQWWGRSDLEALQLARLRRLLVHAQRHVPYYSKLFAKIDFDAGKVKGLQDLHRLPFLTKAEIRADTAAFKSEHATGLARFNTGGSSGEPLIFFVGKERVSHDVAAKWRATRWWGVDIGDPEIVVWGSPIELGAQDRTRRLRDLLLRTHLLPAFEMSETKLDGFLHTIRTVRPKMLFGYPSALAHIASHARARNIRMDDLGIRVTFVTSEKLYDEQRSRITQTFGCRVANGYGGRDAGFIAHECPESGMHITAEDVIVETIGEDGGALPPGMPGEIVVTHLATRDFPFIRYRTGDIGVIDPEACRCGRGLPLLKEIQGRATDFVVAHDGTVLHGLALIYVLRDLPEIKGFKIVQETQTRTRVQVVPQDDLQPQTVEKIRRGFKARLGNEVDIVVEQVDQIARESSGKYRYVVSHIQTSSSPIQSTTDAYKIQ